MESMCAGKRVVYLHYCLNSSPDCVQNLAKKTPTSIYLFGVLHRFQHYCLNSSPDCVQNLAKKTPTSIYLFGVLHRFQHCIGHIMMVSFMGRGNQYIQLVKVQYHQFATTSL